MDGSDGKYLLSKLAEAYCMILEGKNTDNFVIKNGSRRAEQVYEHHVHDGFEKALCRRRDGTGR